MKPRILCVDDEPHVLESLRDCLRRRFEVVGTTNGFEALRMMVDETFPVVLSDMRMPRINGSRFLTLAREHAPDTVRLLLTGQSTLEDAVAAVNDGQIYRFLIKPCPTPDLISAIDAGIRRHEIQTAERRTAEQLLDGALRAMSGLAEMVDPTAAGRAARVREIAVSLARAAGVSYARELGRACELVQLGAAGLDSETLRRLQNGRVGADQAAELEQLAQIAAPLVDGIPRLEIERTVLKHLCRPYEATRPGQAGTPIGARILQIALDYDLLELQGIPDHARTEAMRRRSGRYDEALLATFSDIVLDYR